MCNCPQRIPGLASIVPYIPQIIMKKSIFLEFLPLHKSQIYGYTPLTSRRTYEKKKALFEKRGERLYRAAISGIWYPFGWESPYLFVDIGAEHPVMLTSGKTFDSPTESGEKIQTCMECEVYYHDNGEDIFLGALESLNTGCPIAYDETGIYVAGAHGVEKYIVDESCETPFTDLEVTYPEID